MFNKQYNYNDNKYYGGGMSFCTALTILFIALKLLGKITWSWLWVLSPLWIPIALVILVCAILLIAAFVIDKTNK